MCVSCLLKVLEEDGLYVNNFKENENIEIFILTREGEETLIVDLLDALRITPL